MPARDVTFPPVSSDTRWTSRPATLLNSTVCEPAQTDDSVTGAMPLSSPSTSTVAPAGSLSIDRLPTAGFIFTGSSITSLRPCTGIWRCSVA